MKMTAAEFRALGVSGEVSGEVRPAKVRTTKRAVTGTPYRTRCSCGQEFTVIAEEDRHVAVGHNRFEIVR